MTAPMFRVAALSSLALLALVACQPRTVTAPPPPPQAPLVQAPLPVPVVVAPPPPPKPIPTVDVGNRTDVALLLPLTGGPALARDLLDAAQMAVAELGSPTLAVTPKDTKGTPEGAASAAREALDDGAKLIIGPLTAAEVEAVQPLARAAGVNILAFSTTERLAGNGTWLLGFLPRVEIARVVGQASASGITSFAVLAPGNAYGQAALDAYGQAIAATGGSLAASDTYPANATDLRAYAKPMAAKGANGEYGALLLPEPDTGRLKNLASLLPVFDLDLSKVRLLGTGVWDTPKLAGEAALVGGWYTATNPEDRAGFETRFAQAYGHAPARLATLAYDAVGVAAVLEKTPNAGFTAAALTNPSGFAGPNGIFRLLPDGTTQRGLAVIQVERSGTSVVSPAPDSFNETGQ